MTGVRTVGRGSEHDACVAYGGRDGGFAVEWGQAAPPGQVPQVVEGLDLDRFAVPQREPSTRRSVQYQRDRRPGPRLREITDDLRDDPLVVFSRDERLSGGSGDLEPVQPGVPSGQYVEEVGERLVRHVLVGKEPREAAPPQETRRPPADPDRLRPEALQQLPQLLRRPAAVFEDL